MKKLIPHRVSYLVVLIAALLAADGFAQVAPVAGTGTAGYSGDGLQAVGARLNGPSGVSIDSAGNFYIADLNNSRIRKVSGSTGVIVTFVGDGAVGFWNFEGGPATPTALNHPTDVAVDPDGAHLYFADFSQWSAIGATTLFFPDSLNTGPSRVQRVDIATHTIRTVPIALRGSVAIALDSQGNLYISERHGQRILKYVPSSGAVTTIAGTGTAGFSGDGGAATAAQLHDPAQVTVDAAGNVYFADSLNHRIRKIAAGTGIISTVVGSSTPGGQGGYTGDGGPAASAQLNHPQGIAVDAGGNMLIADTFNQRIRRVNARTGLITTMIGPTDGGDCTVSVAALQSPFSVEVNPAGDFAYMADHSGHRIWKANVIPETLPPTLTSLTPASGAPGSSVVLSVSGSGFMGGGCRNQGTTVSVSGTGVTASAVSLFSDTSLGVTLSIAPDAAAGAREVRVVTGGGPSSPAPFTVTVTPIPAPTLTSITPPNAGKGSTATITFTGTNFDTSGKTNVTAEGAGISIGQIEVSSPTSLTAVVNVGGDASLGSHNLRVVTPGGTSNAVALSVVPDGPAFVYQMPQTLNPTQQAPLQVALERVFSDPVTATLTMTFSPNASNPKDDPNVTFVNSQTSTRTATVTFPANATTAEISLPQGVLQAGTVAGTIQLEMNGVKVGGVDVIPGASSYDVQIPRTVPVITSVRILNRTSGGFDVEITGYSTSREITAATFDFGEASGKKLLTVHLQPDVSTSFTGYYQSDSSAGVGGAFVYVQPFIVQQGDASAVASVTVTLSNTQGASQPKTAS